MKATEDVPPIPSKTSQSKVFVEHLDFRKKNNYF